MDILSVLYFIPMGICVLNKEKNIVLWNKGMTRLTSIKEKDIINQSLEKNFPIFSKVKYQSRLDAVFKSGLPIMLSSQIHGQLFKSIDANKKDKFQNTSFIRLNIESQHFVLIACEDVTDLTNRIKLVKEMRDKALQEIAEREILEHKLITLKKNLMERNLALTDFANMIALKVQRPLQQITTLSQFIMEDADNSFSEESKNLIEVIYQLSSKSELMIEDLINFNAASEIKSKNKVCLNSLIDDAIKITKSENFINIVNADKNYFVLANYKQLLRAFIKIIENSIKFKSSDRALSIKIKIAIKQRKLNITIADNGIGFEQKASESIFNPFFKTYSENDYPGFGMGLSLAKKIIKEHDGEISASSILGEGTIISIKLAMAA